MPSIWIIIAGFLLVSGLLFFWGAIIGILRFPSFLTRMHAAGKADTLSSMLMILGFVVLEGHKAVAHHDLSHVLICLKLILIMGFVFVASPTAAHALIDAGYKLEGGDEKPEDEARD